MRQRIVQGVIESAPSVTAMLRLALLLTTTFALAPAALAADGRKIVTDADWKIARTQFDQDYRLGDEATRLRAIERLGECDYIEAVKLLIQVIAKPDPRVVALRKEQVESQSIYENAYKRYLADARQRGDGKVAKNLHDEMQAAMNELQSLEQRIFAMEENEFAAEKGLGRTTVADGIAEIVKTANKSSDRRLRSACVRALGAIGGADATKVITAAIEDGQAMVRLAAAESLAQLAGDQSTDLLIGMLQDAAWQVRAAAINSLVIRDDRRSVRPLIDALAIEPGRLREDLDKALTRLTGEDLHGDHDIWNSWWQARGAEFMVKGRPAPPEPKPAPAADPDDLAETEAKADKEKGAGKEQEPVPAGGSEPGEKEGQASGDGEGDAPRHAPGAKKGDEKGDAADKDQRGEDPGATPEDQKPDDGEASTPAPVPGSTPAPATEEKPRQPAEESITFYGIESRSKRILFVIDVSGSMSQKAGAPEDPKKGGSVDTEDGAPTKKRGGKLPLPTLPKDPTKLDVARYELHKAVLELEEDAMFNLIVYSEDCQVMKPGTLLKATDQNKLFAFGRINDLKPSGGTNIHGSLDLAFQLAGRDEKSGKLIVDGVDTIFFLSDGMPTVGAVTDTAIILTQVNSWNRQLQIKIHAIGVGQDHSVTFLQALAQDNQGQYVSRK